MTIRPSGSRRFVTALAGIAVTAVLGAACAAPVNAGTVVDKRFDAEHTRRWPQQIQTGSVCSGSGTSRFCTPIYTTVWHTDTIPDRWFVTLEACEVEGTQQRCRRQEHRVDKDTYDRVELGDFLAREEDQ